MHDDYSIACLFGFVQQPACHRYCTRTGTWYCSSLESTGERDPLKKGRPLKVLRRGSLGEVSAAGTVVHWGQEEKPRTPRRQAKWVGDTVAARERKEEESTSSKDEKPRYFGRVISHDTRLRKCFLLFAFFQRGPKIR